MKKFIPLIVVALFALMVGSASAGLSRWAIGINKTSERAHAYAERLVESDDEITGYDRPDCHHPSYAPGRPNYSEVRCAVAMHVQGGGFRDYQFRRWSTRNASGKVVVWESFGPTPEYATGYVGH